MVEDSNQELYEYANKRIPLPPKDLSDKDGDLLKKVNLIAQAVEVEDKPYLGRDVNEEWVVEDSLRRELPSAHRMLVDEIYKVLYFNNKDPETYTIAFWAEYFQISPASVRNIVNYMAYPIIDVETKKVKQVLYFIDIDLMKSRKMLSELDRDSYFEYLEADYRKRMIEEHGDELGLFGDRVGPFIEGDDENLPELEGFLNNKLEAMIKDDRIIEDID